MCLVMRECSTWLCEIFRQCNCDLFKVRPSPLLAIVTLVSPLEENREMLERVGFFEKYGKEWLFPSIQDAVNHSMVGQKLVSACFTTLM